MVNSLNRVAKAAGRRHEHVYAPRGGCKEVFESREEEVLVSGPAGTGKSRACLEKIFAMCLTTPNTRALILRKTLASLGSSALETWRKFVIREALATGVVVYYGGSREEPAQYRFKNGSTVVIGGLDKAMRIMSTEYDIIYIQEATECTIDDIEMCKTRLRNWVKGFQQLIMDCNPGSDKHWLLLRCRDGLCKLIESRHEDNPRLFDDDGKLTKQGAKYIGILDKLTGVRYKRLRLGLWVSAEGIIYEEFDPATHVLNWSFDTDGNKLPLPAEWPRYWAIDFGYANPFVLKCYAIGDDGEVYMYREIYMTGRTVGEHAETIMNIVCPEVEVTRQEWDFSTRSHVPVTSIERQWIEPVPDAVICDHDAEGRKTFERATGLGTVAANKAVNDGIDIHKERLKGDDQGPRFYLMADSLVELDQSLRTALRPTCTADEYPSYAWQVDTDGRQLDKPVKKDDHGMDTDRYLSMFLDFKGEARFTMMNLDDEEMPEFASVSY